MCDDTQVTLLPGTLVASRLASLTLALVAALLAFAPTAPGQSPAARHPSQDLPQPPARCLLPSGAISPEVRPCWVNKPRANRPTVVLWGDSHAIQMMPAVQRAIRGRNVNFAMFALGACPPQKFGRSKDICKEFNYDALRFVTRLQERGDPVRVILGANWQGYRTLHRKLFITKTVDPADVTDWVVEIARVFPKRAPSLARKLGRMGVHVDVIGETATVPDTGLKKCRAGEEPFVCALPRNKALPHEADTRAWLRGIMRPLPNDARLIEFNSVFCNRRVCRGRQDGIYTFFNDLHISATRAKTLKRFFVPSITRLKNQR
ncbi:hypothetical protein GCM10027020_33280 [Nocardioides salsibiostraticola]